MLVHGPCLTAIKERAEDACLVDTHLGVLREEAVFPHPLGQFAMVAEAFRMRSMLISVTRHRFVEMVEPR